LVTFSGLTGVEGVPIVRPAPKPLGFTKRQRPDAPSMMHNNETARDDSVFEDVVGVMAALSVLCFMGLLLFI
jgi:hypothetical protein